MYYSKVIAMVTDANLSPIKSIDWTDEGEINKLKQLAEKFNIKGDCKTITDSLKGALGSWVFATTKEDVIGEQQNMINKLCDAAAFFCALSYAMEEKIQKLRNSSPA